MSEPNVTIIGAGMAGFGAAYQLHQERIACTIYDNRPQRGGHTSSYAYDDGFIFDEGPHVSFTENKRIQQLFADSVGGRFERIKTYVNNYWHGHWIKHPAQVNLHGLPEDLVIQCIKDFVQAQQHEPGEIGNYEDWLRAAFGPTFAMTFPAVYTRKYHTTDARNLTTDWLGPRLYRPDLEEVLRGALCPETPDVHYIDKFRYPSHGGFVSYLDKFLPMAEQHYGRTVTAIDPAARTIRFADGEQIGYEQLISSVPLPELIPMVAGAPDDVRDAAAKLSCSQVVIVNVGINRPDISPAHWTYFYDEDICFARLSFPKNLSPHTVPDGCSAVQAEVYFSEKWKPMTGQPKDWIEPVVRDLIRVGLVKDDQEVIHRSVLFAPHGNVIFDQDRPGSLATVHGYLDDVGIAYCGRYGDWGYMWTDQSFVSGEKAARKVLGRLGQPTASAAGDQG
ncbi:MAG: NAD(P)-binding protein [Planctomycetes bacterium]|jgi:protoporphyrinogen oxidase|nr:NAD(P)-binding protein [Planctomycetota bacterium]